MRKLMLALLVSAVAAFAADLTGTWTGELLAEGDTHPAYVVIKQDGNTLTGSGGPDQGEQHPISNGKVDGEKMSFDVKAGEGTLHFELTTDGASLKGTVVMKTDEGDHSGTVTLKRAS